MKKIILILAILWNLVDFVQAGTWKDNFSQGLVNWKVEGEKGNWKAENQECIGDWVEGNALTFLITGDAKWDNYTVECDVKVLGLAGGDAAGIVLHYQNPDSYFWFGISIAWTRYEAGMGNQRLDQKPVRVPVEKWLTLRASVKDKVVTCFIDGQQVFELKGETTGQGKTGFYLLRSRSAFSNFSVSGPRVVDGGPGFAVHPQDKLATTWGKLKVVFVR